MSCHMENQPLTGIISQKFFFLIYIDLKPFFPQRIGTQGKYRRIIIYMIR